MKHFSLSEILGHSWKLFKANAFLLVSLTILNWALSFIIRYLGDLGEQTKVLELLPLFAFTEIALIFISVLMHIGVIKIVLDMVDGNKAKPEELLSHTNLFWKFVAVSIIVCAVLVLVLFVPVAIAIISTLLMHNPAYLAIGLLALIPASYLFLTFCFTPLILVDKNTKIIESFRHSAKITKDNKWSLMGFFLVLMIINILGSLPVGLGLLITFPVTFLAYLSLYRKLA